MLDLRTGLDTADGGYQQRQRVQVLPDFFGVSGRDALFELEQDCFTRR